MKTVFKIVFIISVSSAILLSQEKNEDTLKTNAPVFPRTENFDPGTPNFELYRTLYFSEDNAPQGSSGNIWLWTEYSISDHNPNRYLTGSPEPHMLANFHDIYVENSKFNVVRAVLAMAKLGAVGYLAYKSIQKHGFWDNE